MAVRKILAWFLGTTVFLGVVMLAFAKITGVEGIVFLSQQDVPNAIGLSWYKIDLNAYLRNIKTTFNTLQFTNIIPTHLPTLPSWSSLDTITLGFTFMGKCICWLINWIIFVMDLLILSPLKITFHAIYCLLSLLGINTSFIGYYVKGIYEFNFYYIPLNW